MRKMILAGFLALLFFLGGWSWQKEGCVLQLDTKEKKACGQELWIYRLAQVDETESSLCFMWEEAFERLAFPVERLGSGELTAERMRSLEEAAREDQPMRTVRLDQEGKAREELPPGIYLIIQPQQEGGMRIQSSLGILPQMNETGDGWKTEVWIYPKISLEEEPPETGEETFRWICGAAAMTFALLGMIFCVVWKKEYGFKEEADE